ncbi:TspO/MBR family protein [Sutcliffiella halmapala]|uniref:TspO/MBR family protein n=1 Tax=Sutcliffiella halmapala TaxID=79882 RepID=UPI0009954489|nr:TspO/MBR family protein [Sutcliffiella halmapala]
MRLWLQVFAFLLVITVNILANALPLNGQTTGEISNKLNVLFTPAGYVFSIWSVIYLLIGIWIVRQFPKERRNLPIYKSTNVLFILSCVLNSAWIVLWHYEFFVTTVVIMVSLLLTLITLYRRIKTSDPGFFDRLPFSIYLGWISVATIANVSYVLVHLQWIGFGLTDVTWTIIMLIIATILAIRFNIVNRDRVYPFVFVWAFIGIGVQNMGAYSTISYVAYSLAAVIFLITIFVRGKK